MNPLRKAVYLCVLALALGACSSPKPPAETLTGEQPVQPSSQPADAEQPASAPGELAIGEANGSYTARGETVELKYAYAGRGQRFGSDSMIILLTDKPIPAHAVADELKSQRMFYDEKIRGLEYVIEKDGYWVRFHPSQYQESHSKQLKEFSVENEMVRGYDEDDTDVSSGKYSRKVRFVASVIKE